MTPPSTLDPSSPPTEAVDLSGVFDALGREVYRPLPAVDRTEAIFERLRGSIAIGVLRPGDRLPSEAEMSESFGVSPATLREALAQLRAAGLVETRRGRNGGTFIVDTIEPARAAVERKLDAYSVVELRDVGDERAAISGMSARLAAARSGEREVRRLQHYVSALTEAQTPGECARAHSRFWLELAVTAQSRRLLALELRQQLEIGDLLWTPLSRPLNLDSVAQSLHDITVAVGTGDSDGVAALVLERLRQDTFHLIDEKLTLALGQSDKGAAS